MNELCRPIDDSLMHWVSNTSLFHTTYVEPIGKLPFTSKVKIVVMRIFLSIPTIVVAAVDVPLCIGRDLVRLCRNSVYYAHFTELPRHILILLVALPLLVGFVPSPLIAHFKKAGSEVIASSGEQQERDQKLAQDCVKQWNTLRNKNLYAGYHPIITQQGGEVGIRIDPCGEQSLTIDLKPRDGLEEGQRKQGYKHCFERHKQEKTIRYLKEYESDCQGKNCYIVVSDSGRPLLIPDEVVAHWFEINNPKRQEELLTVAFRVYRKIAEKQNVEGLHLSIHVGNAAGQTISQLHIRMEGLKPFPTR